MILCDNYLCLYWKKDKNNGICSYDDIELDIAGVCRSCIYFIDESANLDKLRIKAKLDEKN